MWIGSKRSGLDEWVELKNTTGNELNIGGCQLTKNSSGETLILTIPNGTLLGANRYYLVSNYDETNSNISIIPELVDSSITLINSDLQVKLYCNGEWNNGGDVIDIADDGSGDPLKGEDGEWKKSMSRKTSADGTLEENWCTAETRVNWDADTDEFGTPGAPNVCIVVQNEIPVITLIENPHRILIGGSFDSLDGSHATADDFEDGDITSFMIATGAVDTNTLGTYYVDYNVKDAQGADAVTKTLEVIIYSSGGCISNCGGTPVIISPKIIITNEKVVYLGDGEANVTWTTNIETTEQVAYGDYSILTLGNMPKYGYDLVNQESIFIKKEHSMIITGLTDGIPYYFRPIADRIGSQGEVVGIEVFYEPKDKPKERPQEPCNYLLEYIRIGANNNPIEVMKLETFLNVFEGENLVVNGIYEQVDFDAVSRFQKKYFDKVLSPWSHNSSTGYVYITTKKRINELYCEREFPLTTEQKLEISRFSAIFGMLTESSETSFIGDASAGVYFEEPLEVPNEELIGELHEQEYGGKIAGAKDEVVSEDKLGYEAVDTDNADNVKDDKEELVYADSAYSDYYFWAVLILLFLIIVAIYYLTNIRRKLKKVE